MEYARSIGVFVRASDEEEATQKLKDLVINHEEITEDIKAVTWEDEEGRV